MSHLTDVRGAILRGKNCTRREVRTAAVDVDRASLMHGPNIRHWRGDNKFINAAIPHNNVRVRTPRR